MSVCNKIDILQELKLEIELLKKDLEFTATLFNKMEAVLGKISEQQNDISDRTTQLISQNSLTTKEEFKDIYIVIDKIEESLKDRLGEIELILSHKLTSIDTTLTDHIKDENNITNKVNKFVYVSSGDAFIVVWILSNLDFVKFLLK